MHSNIMIIIFFGQICLHTDGKAAACPVEQQRVCFECRGTWEIDGPRGPSVPARVQLKLTSEARFKEYFTGATLTSSGISSFIHKHLFVQLTVRRQLPARRRLLTLREAAVCTGAVGQKANDRVKQTTL